MPLLRSINADASLAVFVLLTLFRCQYVRGDEALYQEHVKLLDDLFLNYDKIALPQPDPKSPVNVTLGIAVAQLIKLDERMEGMNLNVWYRMAWKDHRLQWDPKMYRNISSFKIDSDYLWIPDIMLMKPLTSEAGHVIGMKKNEDDLAWKISVSSDGTAYFNFPGSIYGQCSLTIADYPYDEHKCSFVFTSWVHDGSELVLKLRESNALDFGNYVHNNEWHIVGKEPKSIVKKFTCCPHPYYMISFNIHIRRGASSYVSNYIIPSILIAILSIMMFTLPPEVGKRMEIGINLLLCLSVYLTILNTKMPTRSDAFPLLSKFYGCCIFILTCALLCTCWVVAYYFHDLSGWKIYSMSKFVEIGVLKHLRKALKFPNATKVYPSDILDTVNNQRVIEVKPVRVEKSRLAHDTGTKKPGGLLPPAEVFVKENENKKPVEKSINNPERKSKPENENKKPVEKASNNLERTPKPENESKKPVEKASNNLEKKAKSENESKNSVEKASKNDERKPKPVNENKKSIESPQEYQERKPEQEDEGIKSVEKASNNLEKKTKVEKEKEKSSKKKKIVDEETLSENKPEEKKKEKPGKERRKNQDEVKNEKENDGNKEMASKPKRKKEKRESKDSVDDTDLKEEPAAENDEKRSKKKGKKEGKKDGRKKRNKSEGDDEGDGEAVEKKPVVSVEDQGRESDASQNVRNSRSASRESNNSQTSKKSNNIFANTVAPGLASTHKKERRRERPKKDLGVVNMGADNERNKNENNSNEEEKKASGVREAPSLKDTAEDEKASKKISTLGKKGTIIGKVNFPALDQTFDAKQETKKKHDSIKLLKELSEYFSDHLERKKNRYQWRQAAIVLNRLFLILLCVSIAMSIILVFLAR
ncbi:neuronal acetylcholine receptor subunit alpha-4-like isoform X2 [Dendronephthya gigantea]|uniref:neuronal acetylcholine receptor subunit alpha-4-like isoform X2 n=1 Tax=Dendronephthya gigantea TaxID=151771 RepID=UPI0010694C7A|nr:neuronal acetylcholine receptor subunit alpha-4-like isoform X2 [Dendronephthya gigantea]